MIRHNALALSLASCGAVAAMWFGGILPARAAEEVEKELPPKPQVAYLTPEEELKTIQLPPGYHLELVLSDPTIAEPVVCVFDGNGRLYVDEMRTYMQNIDGVGEMERAGVVSRHESTHGDGVFDKHTIFADKLLLPRMVLPLDDRVLINETDTNDINVYRDTNGDGVSDTKELFFKGGERGGNLEHQQSGLIWGLDNWMYQAVNSFRIRYAGGKVIAEPTPGNGGQWGLGQDDYGKMWFVNAGGEVGPLHFQTPIIYGAVDLPDQQEKSFPEVWPLVGLFDVQGGPGRYRPESGTLNHFTATCGDAIYRGDALPADLKGDLLFGEPVGRLIRRAKIENHDGLTYLRNAYDKSEFIRSTDPNFRPVNMTTGPDGCLYIVDMYRGIIQEGAWVNRGSYLRPVVKQNGLQNNFHRGRIWRLTHDGFKPGPQPHMLDETPAQLVAHLAHPNGWWRETAQKLLVLRGDKSVVPALHEMALSDKNPLARIHAIWTIEGLEALDSALVLEKLKDADPQVRAAAIRAGEALAKKGDQKIIDAIQGMADDADANVVLQVLLTTRTLGLPEYAKFAQLTMTKTQHKGVNEIMGAILGGGERFDENQFSHEQVTQLHKGKAIYDELCFACHGYFGTGMPLDGAAPGATIAPSLSRSRDLLEQQDAVVHILLKGLNGPVDGKTYTAQMVPMESNKDEWIADVASYVRNSFGNRGSIISPADVAKLRQTDKGRTTPWTIDEIRAMGPTLVEGWKDWKLTASHGQQDVHFANDGNATTRWTSGAPATPGMWFDVELPKATVVSGIDLDCIQSMDDYPRSYTVQTSDDGQTWSKPIAQGKGTPGMTQITFAPVMTRFIRITNTGSGGGLYWSIHELRLLAPPGNK